MECKRLKILYIAHERKLGGATLSLLSLIDEMVKRGHEVWAILPTANCPLANELEKRNIPYIAVFFGWIQMPSYWNIFMKLCFGLLYLLEPIQVYYVYNQIKTNQFDIIHSNSSVIDFGARLAQKMHSKHIWHIREFGDADYDLQYLKGKKITWNYINSHADKIVFISKSICKYFDKYVDVEKSCVIYNGITTDEMLQRKYGKRDKIVFLISGNINRNKQQMLVLLAANELRNRNKDFKVIIAGGVSSMSDSKQYGKELKNYIEKKLPGYVFLLGRVHDMKKLRLEADVEIVPSRKEAFGRVTVEAMMGGMPVIASDSGANPELISDGTDGLLFKNGDYNDLADKMEWFIDNNEKIQGMGERAFSKASRKFTLKQNGDKIEKLYYDILVEKRMNNEQDSFTV